MIDPNLLEEALPPQQPPADFAERVVSVADRRHRAERIARTRARAVGAMVLVAAAAAALVLWLLPRGPSEGSATASARTEVRIGREATLVLEPGARVRWSGRTVTQENGNVFYRVEPSGSFVVHTPAGDVSVLGTCFRVEAGNRRLEGEPTMNRRDVAVAAGTATLTALALVTVYEGKVRVSHAKSEAVLGAGEAASVDVTGAKKLDAREALRAREQLTGPEQATATAEPAALGDRVGELQQRLRAIEKEKSGLEKEKGKLEVQLARAEQKLAERTDSGASRARSEFDLDQEDWKKLAETGAVKFRVPCLRKDGWTPTQEKLDVMGLAPDDAETIKGTYQRSYDRVWKAVRPHCASIVGSVDVAEILGPDTCVHVVVDAARKKDNAGVSEAMRLLGETRAGTRPFPPPGTPTHPVFDVMWAMTGEMRQFEDDLAQSLGPEEAKRVAWNDAMCAGRSTFGGSPPKK